MNRALSSVLLAFLMTTTFAYAESTVGTIEGSRPATPAEKQYIAQLLANFKKAMPPVPAGWVFNEVIASSADMDVGLESANYGLRMDYAWHISSKDKEQKESALQKKLTENHSAKRDESGLPKGSASVQARMEEASAKMGEAAAKGDMVAMQRYSAEMEKLGKQMTSAQEGADFPLDEQRKMLADTRAQVTLNTNVHYQSLPGGSKLLGPTAGATFAFRVERDPNDIETQREGWTTLLYGPWKKNETADAFEFKYDKAKKYPNVQTVIVQIQGEPKRAEALAKTLNSAEIQSWLK